MSDPFQDALRRARDATLVKDDSRDGPTGFDLSDACDDDKRRFYAMAKEGRLGPGWKALALKEPIGVWLACYQKYPSWPPKRAKIQ